MSLQYLEMSNTSISTLGFDVSLVPLGFEHAENMFRWMLDREVSSNLGLRTEPSLEKTQQWLGQALNDPQVRAYGVILGGRHVGNVIFDRLDPYLGNARLSMYIGEREARGRGVGSAALRLSLAEAFERLSLNKVWLTVHIYNTRAVRLYLKVGFTMEGVLREEFCLDGRLIPAFYMGILRAEFDRLKSVP
jgi:RimJ/RimL family protein N-acetyltransferase